MKRYLLRQWVGITLLHWFLALPLGIYLATYPLSSWSFYQVATALWFFLFSLILCFWTIYLLGYYPHRLFRSARRFRFPVFRAIYVSGQAISLLILLMGAVVLLSRLLPDHDFFRLSDLAGFWIMQSIAIAQGLHHFFYKFTSGSPSRNDGLLDRMGKGETIDWQHPFGGAIGVELRRIRRLAP
ncbi:MAG: hypothetical protein ACFCVD_23210 [Nodosilinea sp.]